MSFCLGLKGDWRGMLSEDLKVLAGDNAVVQVKILLRYLLSDGCRSAKIHEALAEREACIDQKLFSCNYYPGYIVYQKTEAFIFTSVCNAFMTVKSSIGIIQQCVGGSCFLPYWWKVLAFKDVDNVGVYHQLNQKALAIRSFTFQPSRRVSLENLNTEINTVLKQFWYGYTRYSTIFWSIFTIIFTLVCAWIAYII